MGYPGCVPVVIPPDAASHKLSSRPSRRPLSSRCESTASGCNFRIPAGVKRVAKTCLNIDKERVACRHQAKYFICTCQYFYSAVMSELFIAAFPTRSLFIGLRVYMNQMSQCLSKYKVNYISINHFCNGS